MLYYLQEFFTLRNALTAAVWIAIISVLIYAIAKAYDIVQTGRFERRILRPDNEGRYPVLLVRDRNEIIIFHDRELGFRTMELEDVPTEDLSSKKSRRRRSEHLEGSGDSKGEVS